MLGVAMFSLIVLRSVVRGTPTAESNRGCRSGADADTTHGRSGKGWARTWRRQTEDDEPDRPRLRLKKGKSLKDDLVEIVREDPDAAADILRSWIGKAS